MRLQWYLSQLVLMLLRYLVVSRRDMVKLSPTVLRGKIIKTYGTKVNKNPKIIPGIMHKMYPRRISKPKKPPALNNYSN